MSDIISSRLIRTDRNGTKYYEGVVTCPRCGGAGGADCWKATGWTCYQCGGEGKVAESWVERTPEYEEKLRLARVARAEKRRAYEEANAEEVAKQKATKDCENVCKGLDTCWNRKGRKCESCEHRFYCTLLFNAIESLKVAQTKGVLTEQWAGILDRLQKVDTEEPVRIETMDGEPCTEGKWFEDFYGRSKRAIVKPNGEKVYTSATTDRGLAKYGLRNRKGA